MNRYTVLICDDNEVVHQSLKLYLEAEGIASDSVLDGEAALEAVKQKRYDLIILDIMLPKMFGTDVCREIRKSSDIPIIFLSARSEEFDRILGLELGADDYVTKPFSPKEVAVRVKSILRRTKVQPDTAKLIIGQLLVDTRAYDVRIKGESVKMTPREVELLAYLIRNRGQVVSREQVLNAVWGEDYYGDVRAVDTLLARVRGKIPEHTADVTFRTVYGVGYMLQEKSR